MGEIMRWRLTRSVQRRIPKPETIADLTGSFQISPASLQLLQQVRPSDADPVAAVNAYINNISLPYPLLVGKGLPTGLALPLASACAALLQLDSYFATNDNKPGVPSLSSEVTSLLGPYLGTPEWQKIHVGLSEWLYLGLVVSVLGFTLPVSLSVVDLLKLVTRLLLVVALVDLVQSAPTSITTPDDIYAMLRWRSPLLPDAIVQLLLADRTLVNKSVLVRKPGFADLYITREEWDHYEPAEIASIENILAGELKSKVHVLVNQTQVTVTTEEVTSTLKEQDTTTTDLSQLQQQSSSDISISAHIDGKVDTSGQYGSTQVNTHLGGSLDYSNASTTSKAMVQSHETVARAVSRIEQTTRQVRTVSTLTRSTDKEEHKFDNTKSGATPIVGIYRWVDQIQNIELDRYPHRLIMEFEIPEPGAYTRWLILKNTDSNMINKLPIPLTLDGYPVTATNLPLKSADINATNYSVLGARYMATGMDTPPGTLTVALNLGYPASGTAITPEAASDPHNRAAVENQTDSSLAVPNGYYAYGWAANTLYYTPTDCVLWVAVGGGSPVEGGAALPPGTYTITGSVGPISSGNIPISIQAISAFAYEVNVEVLCMPLDTTMQQWRNDTYSVIAGSYSSMLQAYKDEKAGMTVQQTNPVNVNSPDQNAQTIRQELKRQVIEMLTGTNFMGRNAINWDPTLVDPPTNQLTEAASTAPEIQFLEQAFEWETMSYICYPYYWADYYRWRDLEVIAGNDSNFADFLRSGSARVVVAARPGFEDQVNFYTQFGVLWGGGPMPAPGDPDYLSIADEIKAMQQRPSDVAVIDTWQVRLPTTLIWLVNPKPEGQLPKNPNPTIDTTPKIVSLTPTSGSVGDLVTIAGRNFRDVQSSSTVEFNHIAATPARWSADSIDVAVPTSAATGNVVVTVKRLASDGVTVDSVQSNGMNFVVK